MYAAFYQSPAGVDPAWTFLMTGIVEELDSGDNLGLQERFSAYVLDTLGAGLRDRVAALLAYIPDGEVAWDKLQNDPTIRKTEGDDSVQTVLMLSSYPVSSGGKDFWVAFAYFPIDEADPSIEGIYAVGAAPRTEAGDSPQERALFAWLDSFDVAATTPPGVFLPE
ncbi:MAG: hypothetical protein J0H23_12800 [Micrococcales bacterium]|nr:hypothetical protein [Micrococcales bacterium]OJX69197.1 MAG: hypothetical protein BGO94_11630 [Micrococcales bacterium 72-143]